MDDKSIIIEGKIKWAKVQESYKDKLKKVPQYSLDVSVTKEVIAAIAEAGAKVKVRTDKETGVDYMTFFKPTLSSNGKAMVKPPVVGRNLEPITDLIGNGSSARVKVSLFPYDNEFGRGMAARLAAVQVLDLVKYEPKEGTLSGFEALETSDELAGFKDEDFI